MAVVGNIKTKISYISGVEGSSIYLGNIRIGGPKPWGGGRVIEERTTDVQSILYALNNLFDPAHQPLKTDAEEAELLVKNIKA